MGKVLQKGWRPFLVLVLFFIIWELCTKIFAIPGWLLPAPSQVWLEAIYGWSHYTGHIFSTVQLIIIGFTVGSSIGVLVAVGLHLVPFLRQAFYPLLIVTQNIPIIVLAPLLVIWFGFGMLPKIMVISLVCFFPITISLLDGFRQADRDLNHYMLMAGATKQQIFWKLEWPNALPSLFSGLKISATYSVMGAVISEWLGASKGIGVFMTLASSSFRTDRVFVAILFIVTLSLLFFLVIVLLENMVIKWKSGKEGDNIESP
ncbi:ABC-type nitrate/sulfonate/bicarbonate transport system permease component [Salirhabdus euzebyi]|uniref:ABC-type nitrate/sulfonate/bicarbonate transport system permease component n=1 Tax=Salirhabdus euzebyi TaxID=394506 RepID=A0A841Q4F8_9BACI|nr:ABC transporter permease [Salirhabdus euzebyi]MBB6453220.1 ABC-type nitrate/sulfonate/bicarbonate transport system permease component [Salirhabdus euzebyi]